jgi:Arc/MetJ family transcription regulator
MTKRLVRIDDNVLRQAQQVLGMSTIDETVNAALRHVVDSAPSQVVTLQSLRQFANAARDLGDPRVMAHA